MAKTDAERKVDFRRSRAAKIDQARVNKAWTRTKLAEVSGYDVRTIRTVLSGDEPVRDQTILGICKALGIAAELDDVETSIEVSGRQYGAYARAPYTHYEGGYFAYRRSFTYPKTFLRSLYELQWDEAEDFFHFREFQSYTSIENKPIDHSQAGKIYISPATDLIHLRTIHEGAVRLITLTKMRGSNSTMRGSVLTQSERTMFYQPSVSAIYLDKIANFNLSVHAKEVGPVTPDDQEYKSIEKTIETIEQDVMFVATPTENNRRGIPKIA